ncbi:MAG: hypothetical protein ACI4MQ_05550 [Candidatus Coproplasma sp.]
MGLLVKSKQLNNGYFALPYTLMGKAAFRATAEKALKTVEALFGKTSDMHNDDGHNLFVGKSKRLTTSARTLLGKIHTKEKIFGQKAELSYREITAKLGHSSRTTAANLKELNEVLEKPLKSTYHIKTEYEDKPFILCYEFLFNEELQLEEGAMPVKLTDLEAILVSLIVNNKLNPKKGTQFVASVHNIQAALNIPKSTAQCLIDSLIKKGVCIVYRQYIDENGNVIIKKGEKARNKKEKTLLAVRGRIIRRCNVIYKEYQKRVKDKKSKPEQNTKQTDGKASTATSQVKQFTDEEKFEAIESKFIRDKKYLNLTEKYKRLKNESLEVLRKEKDEAKYDELEKEAKETFNKLCYYLYDNGVRREELPTTFAQLIRNLEA